MNRELLLQHFDRISEAPDAIPRLRRFILDLAVRGKLVEQDTSDEPAAELLKRKEVTRTSGVPENWLSANIGQLMTFQYGKAFPATDRNDQGRVAVFGSNGIVGFCETALVEEPAIIIGRKGSAGALNLCNGPSWTTDVAYFLTPPDFFDIRFLYIALQVLDLGRLGKGVKPGLSRSEAYQLPIVIPPLAEQHRIVAKVDELMALCDQLEAERNKREVRRDRLVASSLNRISTTTAEEAKDAARFHLDNLPRLTTRTEHIKQLRQTILNLAVRGRLVPQDAHDEPAMELLKRIQAEKTRLVKEGKIRKQQALAPIRCDEQLFDIPKHWAWVRLGSVIHLVSGQHLQPPEYTENENAGVAYITGPSDFGHEGLVITRYALVRKAIAYKGQLLLTVKGSGVGKTTVCDIQEVAISRQLMALTAIEWNSNFMEMITYRLAEALRECARSLIPGIAREDVDEFVFGLPPLAEQHRIVAKVDELMALCDQLEASLNTTEADSRSLLEAVLRDALNPFRLPDPVGKRLGTYFS
ncbi:MAG: restriction endonuclease subunit S [Desulfuromonadales bacterium]